MPKNLTIKCVGSFNHIGNLNEKLYILEIRIPYWRMEVSRGDATPRRTGSSFASPPHWTARPVGLTSGLSRWRCGMITYLTFYRTVHVMKKEVNFKDIFPSSVLQSNFLAHVNFTLTIKSAYFEIFEESGVRFRHPYFYPHFPGSVHTSYPLLLTCALSRQRLVLMHFLAEIT